MSPQLDDTSFATDRTHLHSESAMQYWIANFDDIEKQIRQRPVPSSSACPYVQ